ncbi:MAG TPA: sulfate adenylyltransferase subunit CysD, partial [Gaiellaceae bacterium]
MIAAPRTLSHLDELEAEAIHVFREVAAELERPVLLFSGGKDSIVLLRLAEKAFRPGGFPFPVMHVDTGHNFPEVIEFRDRRVAELGERLIVASVQESIDRGRVVEQTGPRASRNQLQTTTLLDAIAENGFDAAIGGARRDEERARAKERIFSFRDDFGQWNPRAQRPELWNLYNARIRKGEHVRVFPISNWTELDVWQYVAREGLELPSIYFAHEREVFRRDEDKARAKERVFSFRDDFGQWDPKNQRPELWNLYNARHRKGEHIRVFPISNWTEMDVWQYIDREEIDLPSIYFAHERE